MDHTELRQEASRLSRLAKECSDSRVRVQLETLARERTTRAIEAERQRHYLPSLVRFASWIGVLAAVTVGGSLALAEWYRPQSREIVVTVSPHPAESHSSAPREPGAAPPAEERRIGSDEHEPLFTRLENFPFLH